MGDIPPNQVARSLGEQRTVTIYVPSNQTNGAASSNYNSITVQQPRNQPVEVVLHGERCKWTETTSGSENQAYITLGNRIVDNTDVAQYIRQRIPTVTPSMTESTFNTIYSQSATGGGAQQQDQSQPDYRSTFCRQM